jgi:hypothetical protein
VIVWIFPTKPRHSATSNSKCIPVGLALHRSTNGLIEQIPKRRRHRAIRELAAAEAQPTAAWQAWAEATRAGDGGMQGRFSELSQ